MAVENSRNVLSQPKLSTTADVVIIGGGPAGIYTSDAIRKSYPGLKQVLLEQSKNLGGSGSRASLQQFRLFQGETELVKDIVTTVNWYRELGADYAVNEFPYLFLARNAQALSEYRTQLSNNQTAGFGQNSEVLNANEIRAKYPFITGDIEGGLLYRQAGRLDLDYALDQITRRGKNSQFALETKFESIIVENNKVVGVETNRGIISTRRVVLASGPFVLHGNDQIKGDNINGRRIIPEVTVYKRESFATPINGLPPETNLFVISPSGAYVKLRTNRDGEGEGIYGYADPDEPKTDTPQTEPIASNYMFPAILYDGLSEAMPDRYGEDASSHSSLARSPLSRSAGYYVETTDGLPFVGKTETEGLYVNTGYSHTGVMSGYGASKRLVNEIINGGNGNNQNPYALNRRFDSKRQILL